MRQALNIWGLTPLRCLEIDSLIDRNKQKFLTVKD
jgi:hypothetical protein